jgi:hypothetical protein
VEDRLVAGLMSYPAQLFPSRAGRRSWARSRCGRRPWCRSRRRRWCWAAGRELEFADAREPIMVCGRLVIFVRVPKGDAIGGVNRGHGIVAPETQGGELGAAAISHYCFALAEVT